MNKKVALLIVAAVLLTACVVYLISRDDSHDALVLHGNVDIRQVELPCAESERMEEVLVREGDHVKAGQVLARLQTSRLLPRVQQAEARLAAQTQALLRLENGTRPEETAQVRAALSA